MSDDDWAERWRAGRTGFHEGRPNDFLVRFAPRLDDHARVLVPLCGKSADLTYLAERGHRVVGVELVEAAVQAYFAERGVTPSVAPRGPLVEYTHEAITIFAGDVFALDRSLLGPIDAIYDRAALIALPEALRARYVDHLIVLSAPWVHALTITLAYDQAAMPGPPFSVTEAELRRLYDGYAIEALDARDDTLRGTALREGCFLITG